MNGKNLLLKRIFILGFIFVFFTSSYLYAGPKPPRRGKAHTSAARQTKVRQKKSPRTSSRSTISTPSVSVTHPVHTPVVGQTPRSTVSGSRPISTTPAKSAKRKTPQDWLAEYEAHPEQLHYGTQMYAAFHRVNQRVKKVEKKGEAVDPFDKQMSDIFRANTQRFAAVRTSQEWLAEYKKHPEELRYKTPMYQAFVRADQRVKKAEENGEEVDPLDKQMSDIYRANTKRIAAARTPQEWLDAYAENPEEFHADISMYRAFSRADNRVKKAEENGEEVDPLYKQMSEIYRANTTRQKTPQEWLAEYEEHPEELHAGTQIYKAFQHADQRVKRAEENGEEVDPLDKQMSGIYRANTKRIASARTSQEWLAEYEAHPEQLHYETPMYRAFRYADKRTKKAEDNGEEINPLVRQMSDIYRDNKKRPEEVKTVQEVYDIFLQYLRENRSYPTVKSVEYRLVYNRLYTRENFPSVAELNANPELRYVYQTDPELNKLYKLDQLARAAARGEKPWEVFDRDNPLRRQRIGEQQPTEQAPEISAEELHRAYTEMPVEVQTAIRQTEEHYEHVWDNYPTWFNENKPFIIFTPNTKRAFDVLNREVGFGRWNEDLVQTLAALDQMQFGYVDNAFYRVIYRGSSPNFPKAEDFHIVAEEQGVDIPHIKTIITGKVPHTRLFVSNGKLTRMVLEEGVTVQDIKQVIEPVLSYLGEDWVVRMGTHEKGTKPHIHFEWVDNESGMDMSYTLQLDVSAVIPEGPYAQREQGFKNLFGKYVE